MGLLNFIMSAPRIEQIKMAYVGRYVYNRIADLELKSELYWHANEQANYYLNSSSKFDEDYLENMSMRTQYVVLALAMMEMDIDHGLPNFQWYFVKRPLLVEDYNDNLWHLAIESLNKRSGINVDFIPKRIKGNEVKKPV